MAPKQDPKPKFQEGNKLSVFISDRFVLSGSAGVAGEVQHVS